jgi:hypothetical protein
VITLKPESGVDRVLEKKEKGTEKWKVGRSSCAWGFQPKEKIGEIENLFIFKIFSKLQNYLNFGRFYSQY